MFKPSVSLPSLHNIIGGFHLNSSDSALDCTAFDKLADSNGLRSSVYSCAAYLPGTTKDLAKHYHAPDTDIHLVDESIHLASTFQLVRFPHVIEMLWGADDSAAVKVAGKFYQLLLQNTKEGRMSVSHTLHNAVLQLRNMESNSVNISKWAPFIHIGS